MKILSWYKKFFDHTSQELWAETEREKAEGKKVLSPICSQIMNSSFISIDAWKKPTQTEKKPQKNDAEEISF